MNSSTYRGATTKCTGKVIGETNNLKLPTVLLFVESKTTMALVILTEQRDFEVQVLVKAEGMKLLKVFSTEIMVI